MVSTGQATADSSWHGLTVWESINIADQHIFNTDIEVNGATAIVSDSVYCLHMMSYRMDDNARNDAGSNRQENCHE